MTAEHGAATPECNWWGGVTVRPGRRAKLKFSRGMFGAPLLSSAELRYTLSGVPELRSSSLRLSLCSQKANPKLRWEL